MNTVRVLGRFTAFGVTAALLGLAAPAWAAPSLSVSQSFSPEQFVRASSVQVTVEIDGDRDGDTAFALGFEQLAPSGWRFESVISTSLPLQFAPPEGDSGLLEFIFQGAVDTFPQTVVYELRAPVLPVADAYFNLKGIGIFAAFGPLSVDGDLVVVSDPDKGWHVVDSNRDATVDLNELLRLIQLYNSDTGFHCDDTSEDGFATGPGLRTCIPHNSDYVLQDWRIALSELLRTIQFFRYGVYVPCNEPEDGFCPNLS